MLFDRLFYLAVICIFDLLEQFFSGIKTIKNHYVTNSISADRRLLFLAVSISSPITEQGNITEISI